MMLKQFQPFCDYSRLGRVPKREPSWVTEAGFPQASDAFPCRPSDSRVLNDELQEKIVPNAVVTTAIRLRFDADSHTTRFDGRDSTAVRRRIAVES